MNFRDVYIMNVLEGSVNKITDSKGIVLWKKQEIRYTLYEDTLDKF